LSNAFASLPNGNIPRSNTSSNEKIPEEALSHNNGTICFCNFAFRNPPNYRSELSLSSTKIKAVPDEKKGKTPPCPISKIFLKEKKQKEKKRKSNTKRKEKKKKEKKMATPVFVFSGELICVAFRNFSVLFINAL
tara:strand:+ start:141 stop:545 length:405 start_codon:yes stop_codon:yes gene_type:complete